jgi:hypothetical protein
MKLAKDFTPKEKKEIKQSILDMGGSSNDVYDNHDHIFENVARMYGTTPRVIKMIGGF